MATKKNNPGNDIAQMVGTILYSKGVNKSLDRATDSALQALRTGYRYKDQRGINEARKILSHVKDQQYDLADIQLMGYSSRNPKRRVFDYNYNKGQTRKPITPEKKSVEPSKKPFPDRIYEDLIKVFGT